MTTASAEAARIGGLLFEQAIDQVGEIRRRVRCDAIEPSRCRLHDVPDVVERGRA
jgi:hypothetical protein